MHANVLVQQTSVGLFYQNNIRNRKYQKAIGVNDFLFEVTLSPL
jgi:hypothetical protein